MKFHTCTLKNGLTLIAEQRETAVSCAIGFFARTGARDETIELAGVSHFLEHMMFKGTSSRSALDITYQLGALGAQANAYTSEENTVYYMAVLPEYFSKAVELLSDMLRPSLDAAEFDVEKKVILEEIALYQDRPTHALFERSLREFFGAHPAGNSVLGTLESVSNLTQAQMREYFERRYGASNLVLAATGNFDWEEFVDLAEKHCGHWASGAAGRDYAVHVPAESEVRLTKAELNRAHLCLLSPGPSAQESSRYAAEVLSCILGDHSGSRAYWALVDKGLADCASIDVDTMDRTGVIYGYTSSVEGRIHEVGDALRAIMSSAADFRDEDLSRAVTKLSTRLVLQGESSMRRLMSIGLDWIYRATYSTLQEELSRIQSVNRAEISDLLEAYDFRPTNKVVLVPESS